MTREVTNRERGVTLVEVVVVGVLATIVMLALTGFYINSQGTWMDSSGQALTQREGTLLMQILSDNVHAARSAQTMAGQLILDNGSGLGLTERCHFWWSPTDSLIHMGTPSVPDQGPIIRSTVTDFSFYVTADMVCFPSIVLRTPDRHLLSFRTNAGFYNKP